VERLLLQLPVRVVCGLRWGCGEAGHWLRGLREESLLLLEQQLLQLRLLLLGTRACNCCTGLQLLQLQAHAQWRRSRTLLLLLLLRLLLRRLLLALRL